MHARPVRLLPTVLLLAGACSGRVQVGDPAPHGSVANDTDPHGTGTADTDVADTDPGDTDPTDTDAGPDDPIPTAWAGSFTSRTVNGETVPISCGAASTIRFTVDPTRTRPFQIGRAVCDAGYPVDRLAFGGTFGVSASGSLPLTDGWFTLDLRRGDFTGAFTDADGDGTYDHFDGDGFYDDPVYPGWYQRELSIHAVPASP